MQKEIKNLLKVLLALFIVLLFLSIIRVYFYFSNQDVFAANLHLMQAFLYGLYYDFRFILLINSPVLFMFFLPFRIRNTIFWQGIVKILFLVINFSVLLFNLITAKFYSALSGDFLAISESRHLIHAVFLILSKIKYGFANSWDLILFAAFAFIVLWQIFPSINNMLFERTKANKLMRSVLSSLAIVLFLSGIYEHAYRTEHWQTSLFRYVNRPTALLSINNSYQLLHLYLAKKEVIPENKNLTQLNNLFSVYKNYKSNLRAKKNLFLLNVNLNKGSIDEFINTLNSLGFSYRLSANFYATHKTAAFSEDELLLSLPEFIDKPIYQTKFAFNNFQSIADILRKQHYQTFWLSNQPADRQIKAKSNFYGFDYLIAKEDIDKALIELSGKIEAIKQNYFVFMDFKDDFSKVLNFLSHEYFNKNTFIIINIKQAAKKDFAFGKTLFLIPENFSKIDFKQDTLTDLDIFPSLIDYLGLESSFTAFGKSIFKEQEKEWFQYTGNDYILLNDSLLLRYNGVSTKWLINYKKDADEYYDLQDDYPVQKINMENKIRAVIQAYKKQLINDQ